MPDALDFAALDPQRVDVPPVLAVQIDGECGTEPHEIQPAMGAAFGAVGAFMGRHALQPVGAPRTVYHTFGEGHTSFTVTFPVAPPPQAVPGEGEVRLAELEGGPAFRFTHTGPYEGLRDTYGVIEEWLRAEGLFATEADWGRFMPLAEEYVNDPSSTPPAELVTHIYLPR